MVIRMRAAVLKNMKNLVENWLDLECLPDKSFFIVAKYSTSSTPENAVSDVLAHNSAQRKWEPDMTNHREWH